MTVSDNVRNQTGTKVTSQVNRIAGLPTETSTNTEDQEEQRQTKEVTRVSVLGISKAEDDKDEQTTGDEFGPPHGFSRHELSWVRAEDSGGGGGTGDRSQTRLALEGVDGVVVVSVHDEGSRHAAEELAHEVDGELAPWVTAVKAVGQGDGRVEMAAGFPGDVVAQHDSETVCFCQRLDFFTMVTHLSDYS